MVPDIKQRDEYWDVAKGVLILLVVLGHVIQYGVEGNVWRNPVFRSICSFHMPLFMVISGYFSWNGVHRNALWLLSRVGQLVLPMVSFMLILAFADVARVAPTGDVDAMVSTFMGRMRPPLWYLCVLLECSVLGWVMFRSSHWGWRCLWVVLPMFLAVMFPYMAGWLYGSAVPGNMLSGAGFFGFMWPFFLMGLYLRWRGVNRTSIPHTWALCLPLALLCCYHFRAEHYVYVTPFTSEVRTWLPSLFRFVAGGVGSLAMLYVLKLAFPLLRRQKWLLKLGVATMAIYILHQLFLSLGGNEWVRDAISCSSSLPLTVCVVLLFTILLTAGSYLIYVVSSRNRWCALLFFGEKMTSR